MTERYTLIKERALNSFELLLIKWGISYQKIGDYEYDFLSPSRSNDTNFGACRFNTSKGIGADFAGVQFLTAARIRSIGVGFDREDFAGYTEHGDVKTSFDCIGLAQRVYNLNSYKEAASKLKSDLDEIDGGSVDTLALLTQSIKREAEIQAKRGKSIYNAARAWSYCSSIQGTLAENYLKARNIIGPFNEPNMKFHRSIYNSEVKTYLPALIFKISKSPDSVLLGVHRIYLSEDGTKKANVQEAKKAIGLVQGNGIWFGTPCDKLYVCEGPENAVDVRYAKKRQFVVSTVYATNFHSLVIPDFVKKIVIIRDPDPAGLAAATKASKTYTNQGKQVIIMTGTPRGTNE